MRYCRRSQEDGVLQDARGNRGLVFQDKVGSLLWKVLMDCWGRGMLGLVSRLFMRRWKRCSGQWNV